MAELEQIASRIHQQNVLAGKKSTVDTCFPMATLMSTFDFDLTADNLDNSRGIILEDVSGRSVGVYQAETRQSFLFVDEEPYTDVLILATGKAVMGWVARSQLTESPGAFTVNRKQLRNMPTTFSFHIPCPHLAVYGGMYSDDDHGWVCHGCGELILAVAE